MAKLRLSIGCCDDRIVVLLTELTSLTRCQTMSPTSKPLEHRKVHVNGLESLLRLRGTSQTERILYHKLFKAGRTQMVNEILLELLLAC